MRDTAGELADRLHPLYPGELLLGPLPLLDFLRKAAVGRLEVLRSFDYTLFESGRQKAQGFTGLPKRVGRQIGFDEPRRLLRNRLAASERGRMGGEAFDRTRNPPGDPSRDHRADTEDAEADLYRDIDRTARSRADIAFGHGHPEYPAGAGRPAIGKNRLFAFERPAGKNAFGGAVEPLKKFLLDRRADGFFGIAGSRDEDAMPVDDHGDPARRHLLVEEDAVETRNRHHHRQIVEQRAIPHDRDIDPDHLAVGRHAGDQIGNVGPARENPRPILFDFPIGRKRRSPRQSRIHALGAGGIPEHDPCAVGVTYAARFMIESVQIAGVELARGRERAQLRLDLPQLPVDDERERPRRGLELKFGSALFPVVDMVQQNDHRDHDRQNEHAGENEQPATHRERVVQPPRLPSGRDSRAYHGRPQLDPVRILIPDIRGKGIAIR